METLILTILIGLGLIYFATQNTAAITIQLGQFILPNIPVYLIAIVSLLLGLLVAWVLNVIDWASFALTLSGKNNQLRNTQHTVEQLKQRVHDLEVENHNLRSQRNEATRDVIHERIGRTQDRAKSFVERVRDGLATIS